eukprot:15343752-Ditylum_brightwellii.AAC.1
MNYDSQAQIDVILWELALQEDEKYLINHAKRHQEGQNLIRQATMNNVADALATTAQEILTWQQHNTSPLLYQASQIGISINNKVITRKIEQEMQQASTSIEFRTYLEDKYQWKPNIADLIAWELHGSNLTSLSFYQHWFVAKSIHKCLPCLGEKITALALKTCPCCEMHTETFGLFLYCTHNTKTWHNLQELLTDIYI